MARTDEKEVLILNIYRNEKTGELRGDYIGWDKLFPANGRWDNMDLTEDELKMLVGFMLDRGYDANREEHITVGEILPALVEHFTSVTVSDVCACAKKVGEIIKEKEPRVTVTNHITEQSIKVFVDEYNWGFSMDGNTITLKKPKRKLTIKEQNDWYRFTHGYFRCDNSPQSTAHSLVWGYATIEDFRKECCQTKTDNEPIVITAKIAMYDLLIKHLHITIGDVLNLAERITKRLETKVPNVSVVNAVSRESIKQACKDCEGIVLLVGESISFNKNFSALSREELEKRFGWDNMPNALYYAFVADWAGVLLW